MRKCLILLFTIFSFYIFISASVVKSLIIPKDALRIRIVPNSNSKFDQNIKSSVRNKLEITMYDLLKNASSSEEAREIIKRNLNLVDNDVRKAV